MNESKTPLRMPILAAMVMLLVAGLLTPVAAHPEGPAHHSPMPAHATQTMRAFAADQDAQQYAGGAEYDRPCTDGMAGSFPCANVDLKAFMPLADIGGTRSSSKANDIWGWTDPTNGREYAIIGRVFGTSFVDITNPTAPVYLGQLPTHGAFGSSWRDIKVHADHAFIVSEAQSHGMQVFDLTQLRGRTGPPVTFSETAHYNRMASAHNIVINEDSGYAYIVGASGKNSCSGGLHMVDIRTPASPSFAGCFSADGYTHDAQCVIYRGPDAAFQGREICLNSNEDTVTIVDVTDKANPVQLSRTPYSGSEYTHQGWLTDDQRYFLLDDELDEQRQGHGTRTRVFDLGDLSAPVLLGYFDSHASAIDHNQYVLGDRVHQANYRAGLRILDLTDMTTVTGGKVGLREVGFFDVYPDDDAAEFNGAWSTYPYFPSGNVIISGIEQGLLVVRPTGDAVGSGGGGGDPDPEPTSTMHVGDLDGSATSGRGGKWDATVTVTVHDEAEAPVAGATVAGSWSAGASGSDSCQTDSNGTCSLTKASIHRNTASVAFTVDGVTHSVHGYDGSANHDPDGDSKGTTITVLRP
jgi:choice-of-anchor B domain-containing protein